MVRPDLHLSPSFLAWLAPYLAVFSRRTRPTAAALAVGALLAVGPRTVTNCLRALGLAEHPSFTAFHRVLNRNTWSGLALARVLVRMVMAAFMPSGRSSSASTTRWSAAAARTSAQLGASTTRACARTCPIRPAAACAG